MPLPKQLKLTIDTDNKVLVNRYRMERRLGAGKFGVAWLVTDLKLPEDDRDRMKVAKEISIGVLQPDETVEAIHEARLLGKLDHPGIVKMFDSFQDKNYFYIVTEYCEGGDLSMLIDSYREKAQDIDEVQIMEWIIEILLAVHYMHEMRVLHRDLKSSNIYLRKNRIKIGDFGISRVLMGTNDMASTFIGTPYFMSPETVKHQGYNSSSDIWSIGCLIYELIAFEHAFKGTNLMSVMYNICEGSKPCWPYEKQYSKDIRMMCESILERDVSLRPSASELLQLPFICEHIKIYKSNLSEKTNDDKSKTPIVYKSKKSNSLPQPKRLTPREKLRLNKLAKADEEATRIKSASKQLLKENHNKYEKMRKSMNPYASNSVPFWTDKDVVAKNRPYTAPINCYVNEGIESLSSGRNPRAYHRGYSAQDVAGEPKFILDYEDDEGGEQGQDVEQMNDYSRRQPPHQHRYRQDGDGDGDEVEMSGGRVPVANWRTKLLGSPDERPITPLKNKMIYNKKNSSLDFKDGIPDEEEMANTYYSQYDEEFEVDEADEKKKLKKTIQMTLTRNDTIDNEIADLLWCMQTELDREKEPDLLESTSTLTEDSVFGPEARRKKICALSEEAKLKLGEQGFTKVHEYLKKARFGKKKHSEKKIMNELAGLIQDPNDCFIVDQLLFLEHQAQIDDIY